MGCSAHAPCVEECDLMDFVRCMLQHYLTAECKPARNPREVGLDCRDPELLLQPEQSLQTCWYAFAKRHSLQADLIGRAFT